MLRRCVVFDSRVKRFQFRTQTMVTNVCTSRNVIGTMEDICTGSLTLKIELRTDIVPITCQMTLLKNGSPSGILKRIISME